MDTNLLRKLKDAGFKFNLRPDEPTDITQGKKLLVPTLEELIGACGKTYKDEYEFFLAWSLNKWFACFLDANFRSADLPNGEGSTPEEAVANLWLALQGDKEV